MGPSLVTTSASDLPYFSASGFFMRVSTAHSAVTHATCGATCLPDSAWALLICAS